MAAVVIAFAAGLVLGGAAGCGLCGMVLVGRTMDEEVSRYDGENP